MADFNFDVDVKEEENQLTPEDQNMTFGLDDVDEDDFGNKPIPAGIYEFVIDEMKFRPSNAGDPMMEIILECLDPLFLGRKIWDYAMLRHAKSNVVKMGKAKIKKYIMAAGIVLDGNFEPQKFADEGIAVGKKVRIKLGVQRPTNPDDDSRNQVKDILKSNDGSSTDTFLNI